MELLVRIELTINDLLILLTITPRKVFIVYNNVVEGDQKPPSFNSFNPEV